MEINRLVRRGALVAAPILFALSGLVSPPLVSDAAAQVSVIAAHPTRYYLFTLCSLLGSALLVPAWIELGARGAAGARRTIALGVAFLQVGAFVAFADSATQLVYWQTGAGDHAEMAALINRYEGAPAAAVIFMVGALALIAGSVVAGVALRRAHVVPLWAAPLIPLGLVLNIAAFTAGSRILLVVSSLVLLWGTGYVAVRDRGEVASAPEPALS